MALMVFKTCCQIEDGLPMGVKIQMMINIILDFVIGIVPFLGDLVDALFRANTRNATLLEEHLREKGRLQLKKSGLPVPTVDPSTGEEFDRTRREEEAHPTRDERLPTTPQPVASKEKRTLFGKKKQAPTDLETGQSKKTNKR